MYRTDAATGCFISCLDQSCAQDPGVDPKAQELNLIHLSRKDPSASTPCQLESHLSAPVIPVSLAGGENSCYHHFSEVARFQMLRCLIPVTLLLQSSPPASPHPTVFVPTKHKETGDPGSKFINILILSFGVCVERLFRP